MSAPWGPVAAGPSALVRSGQASTIEPFQREMTPPTPTPEAAHNPTMNVSRETSTEFDTPSALQQNVRCGSCTPPTSAAAAGSTPGAHHRESEGRGR